VKLPRIVSLLPSTTEIACALDMGACLVGRSHECDYPPSVASLPVLTQVKLPEGGSREIDDHARRLIEHGLSVYAVDAERLRELRPDVILTQDQCAACAVTLRDVQEATRAWLSDDARIVSVAPASLSDVWSDIRRIGTALGAEPLAEQRIDGYVARIRQIEADAAIRPLTRVACVEWLDPLMTAGNWMPELLRIVRADAVLARAREHSTWIEWDALVASDPDVLLVMPCGFSLARTRRELGALTSRPGFAALRAVRTGRAYLADGNAYFNRSGPRLVESIEILAELLHPDLFDFGHAGRAWETLEA
jgi:iron complex transport system substrate-binding protein